MRLLLAATFVLAVASSSAAQSHLADSSGVYLRFDDLGVSYSSELGVTAGVNGVIGYRQANGLDYGFRAGYVGNGFSRTTSLGAEAGYTKRLGNDVFLRFESAASLGRSEAAGRDYTYNVSSLTTTASAGLGREFRLGGSFRVTPSVGVYATSYRVLSQDIMLGDGPRTELDTHYLGLGPQIEVPLSFRLFGKDVTLATTYGMSVLGDRVRPASRGTLRVNF